MAKYIEKSIIFPAINKAMSENGSLGMADVEDIIDDLPIADVKPIRRGHWIEKVSYSGWGVSIYTCSECENAETIPSKFCPNCGAELREIENG